MSSELQTLALSIKRMQYKHHRALDTKMIEIGTTLVQWDALRAISNHPDSSSHKLAGLTFQTDQSFGALANRMADRGLILRVAGTGKTILHRLTPAGEAMLHNGYAVVNKVLAKSLGPLNADERQQLQQLLNKLLDT